MNLFGPSRRSFACRADMPYLVCGDSNRSLARSSHLCTLVLPSRQPRRCNSVEFPVHPFTSAMSWNYLAICSTSPCPLNVGAVNESELLAGVRLFNAASWSTKSGAGKFLSSVLSGTANRSLSVDLLYHGIM